MPASDLLRGHVEQRTDSRTGLGDVFVAGSGSDAEIGELHGTVVGKQDIARLDIAMDHTSLVGIRQSAEHLRDVAEGLRQLDGLLLDSVVERRSFHQLHEHEELIIDPLRGIERRDVGVREAGLDLDLAAEALGQVWRVSQVRQQDLHGFGTIGNQMADSVHVAHASAAD